MLIKMFRTKNINKNFWFSVIGAPILVAVILLIVYCVKGVYPFGSRNISYYDMAQSIIPLYYHTYDVLHGTKDLFWDWYSGAGVSVIDTVGNFVLSPFNLFFFFVKRDMLLEAMSFFLILKISTCAGTMSFYFKKTYSNVEWYWSILAGVLYASGGFVLQYYSNIHFLDIVALFPLIIYFADKLLHQEKVMGYCILMAMGFVINIYLMVMVCIYLVVYSMGKIRAMEKDARKSRSVLLGLATLVAGALSAVISVPTIIALLQSTRAEVSQIISSSYLLSTVLDYSRENKMFMLYGCELTVSVLVIMLLFRWKVLKKLLVTMRLLILMILPIFFEMINQFWHVGGYVAFPMRFGYMLTFTGLILLGEILQLEKPEQDVRLPQKLIDYLYLVAIAMIPFVALALYYFVRGFLQCGIRDTGYYGAYWSALGIMVVGFFLVYVCRGKKGAIVLCNILVLVQVTLGWYGFLAPEDMFSPECTDSIVKNTEIIEDVIEDSPENSIWRVKDDSVSLNANYPFILRKASVSNWTWGAKFALRNVMDRLGYSVEYTRIIDNGGTLFSDTLLGVKSLISFEKPDERLGQVETVAGPYYISTLKYEYPFGVLVSDNMVGWTGDAEYSELEYQNELFKAINNDNEDLISTYEFSDIVLTQEYLDEQKIYRYIFEIPMESPGILYLQATDSTNQYAIYMNEKQLQIPALGFSDNKIYPCFFVNGLLNCGFYDKGIAVCIIDCIQPLEEEVVFGCLDISALQKSMNAQKDNKRVIEPKKNSLYMEVHSAADKYLMLPIGYDANFKVKVNGTKTEALSTVDEALLLIPLTEGKNVIEISFRPNGIFEGLIISLLGVLGMLIFIRYKEKVMNASVVKTGMYTLLFLCERGIILFIYVVPIILTFFMKILLQTKLM